MLRTLASDLALMLEEAHSHHTAQGSPRRSATWTTIDGTVSAAPSPDDIITAALQDIGPRAKANALGISLMGWGPQGTTLTRLRLPGDLEVDASTLDLPDSLLTRPAAAGRPLIIRDVESDPRLQGFRDIARRHGLRSYAGLPLVHQNRITGALHLFTARSRRLRRRDLRALHALADRAAISIQHALLHTERRQWVTNAKALARVGIALSLGAHEEEMCEQVLIATCELTRATKAGVFRYDPPASALRLACTVGTVHPGASSLTVMRQDSAGPRATVPQLTYCTCEPIYVPDMSTEPGWETEPPRSGSAYIVPLVHHEHLLGVCALLSMRPDGFAPGQRTLVDAIMTYASIALHNLGLLRQIRQTCEDLQATRGQLIQIQKMETVGQLAGGIAHDFNNTLTAIQGYAELALTGIQEDASHEREDASHEREDASHEREDASHEREDAPWKCALSEIRRVSARAAGLTRQLLLFSRKRQVKREPLDLNQLIRDLAGMLKPLVGEDILLTLDLTPTPWAAEADETTIEQVIMNLVVNARDAMPCGGQVSISSSNVRVDDEYCRTHCAARSGEFVRISVRDTGKGIDPAIRESLFEPFFTTKAPGEGSGMGLSVVQGIVKGHGGWIDVQSSLGRGSTFNVYVPAIPTLAAERPTPQPALRTRRGNGERVLLVEDEPVVRRFAANALSESGYTVFCASSTQQALDVFRREEGRFDLVFSDFVLPDADGHSLVNRLLRLRPEVRLLFATGYLGRKTVRQTITESGYPYLQKPYSLMDMLDAVRDVLDRTESGRSGTGRRATDARASLATAVADRAGPDIIYREADLCSPKTGFSLRVHPDDGQR